MDSIGAWYKLEDDKKQDIPEVDLHINLWNIKDKSGKVAPFIDFGIAIQRYARIKELILLLPFSFSDDQFTDLYTAVSEPEVARLIFNETDCEVESKGAYSIINITEEPQKKLLAKVKEEGSNLLRVDKRAELKNKTICFTFDEIKQDNKYQDMGDIYIRFRISCDEIETAMFSLVDKPNWFLESGFIKTQIADIKVNVERNLPHDFCKDMRISHYSFMGFRKIHLLLMCNSNAQVDSLSGAPNNCRKLEEVGWNSYLGNKYELSDVIAYHWKERARNREESINNFGRLVRITSAATNYKIIVAYIVSAIILGALGSGLLELINVLF